MTDIMESRRKWRVNSRWYVIEGGKKLKDPKSKTARSRREK